MTLGLLLGAMLLGAVLLAAGAALERRAQPRRGGQVIVRNAPRPQPQATIPSAPPRGVHLSSAEPVTRLPRVRPGPGPGGRRPR